LAFLGTSAVALNADICLRRISDEAGQYATSPRSFDHLVGEREQNRRRQTIVLYDRALTIGEPPGGRQE
jgi:hypothetical protein